MAGEELGLEDLVRVEHVVVDTDAVFVLEIGNHRRLDVVGPVVDVENLLAGRRGGPGRSRARASRAGGKQRGQSCAEAKGPGRADHDAIDHTFSSRCSRSQELITCRNTSYSASLTRVKASTNASPKSFTSGSLARSARKASSSERGRPNGRSCALPTIGSLGCTASTMPR